MKPFDEVYKEMLDVVNQYTNQFKRKKSAWGLHNSKLKQKGSIDMTRIYSYKTSDNIFQKKILQPKEKSHGLVILIDNSASMQNCIFSVVQRATELAIFARRNNINLECYTFTTGSSYMRSDTDISSLKNLKLINLYNKNLSEKDIRNVFKEYYTYVYASKDLEDDVKRSMDKNWSMGSTPLLEGYLGIVERAKLMLTKGIQHVNVCVLTDGGATSTLTYNGKQVTSFLDPFTQNVYNVDEDINRLEHQQLDMLNRMLVDSNITTTHIHITDTITFYDHILEGGDVQSYQAKLDNDYMCIIKEKLLHFDKIFLIQESGVNTKDMKIDDSKPISKQFEDYGKNNRVKQLLASNLIDALCQYYI